MMHNGWLATKPLGASGLAHWLPRDTVDLGGRTELHCCAVQGGVGIFVEMDFFELARSAEVWDGLNSSWKIWRP